MEYIIRHRSDLLSHQAYLVCQAGASFFPSSNYVTEIKYAGEDDQDFHDIRSVF